MKIISVLIFILSFYMTGLKGVSKKGVDMVSYEQKCYLHSIFRGDYESAKAFQRTTNSRKRQRKNFQNGL